MRLGVIADDFTGASDIALTLSDGGMKVTQFIGVPEGDAPPALDAGVVALKSRTAPVEEAISDSVAACQWLSAQGAEQIILKVCSTFDSTPEGNIGPVLETLAEALDARHILVCPAFPENGRSVYQGHLFVKDRLLSESGMQHHPLTPMTDPDLRRVLAAQTRWPVGHVPMRAVAQGAAAVTAAFPQDKAMLIVDAIADDDLRAIGQAAKGLPLLCGGSGIAIGLPANFGIEPRPVPWMPVDGPGVVISGSCSLATRGQVERYGAANPAFEVTGRAALKKDVTARMLADWVEQQSGTPLIYSTADPDAVRATQAEFGAEAVAAALEQLFADLACLLVDRGRTRIVVAGGETSGAVTTALGAAALEIGPMIAPGVPVVRLADRPVALALKSGNFGDEDFFQKALDAMKGVS